MRVDQRSIQTPVFSICVPQYNRTSFFIEACRSLQRQTFREFELCISDDCSTDGREGELVKYLQSSGLSFIYVRRSENGRYDANLRSSIALARGQFCFLLGNDDALASPTTLAEIHATIQEFGPADVIISNFRDFRSGRPSRRVFRTALVGAGPRVAVANFRNFSFVSGIILATTKAHQYATENWDGSEMYQMFIGVRMIAAGGGLLCTEQIAICKDLQIPGEQVDSYARKPRLDPCPIVERQIPLGVMGRLVVDAIDPRVHGNDRDRLFCSVFFQILAFTYPFWVVEYRVVQSFRYALGICLGMRPRHLLQGVSLSSMRRVWLHALYVAATLAGLMVPLPVFRSVQVHLHGLAKRFGNPTQPGGVHPSNVARP